MRRRPPAETLDGVVVRENNGAVAFHRGPCPTHEQIASVAERVHKRMTKWLRRRKLIDDRPEEDRGNETPELSPIEACLQLSLSFSASATFTRLDGAATAKLDLDALGDEHRRDRKSPWSAEVLGFNVHAGVTVPQGDRDALERLLRYGARPPFSLERISSAGLLDPEEHVVASAPLALVAEVVVEAQLLDVAGLQ